MKDFLVQYGKIAIIALVLSLIIAFAPKIGHKTEESINEVSDAFYTSPYINKLLQDANGE